MAKTVVTLTPDQHDAFVQQPTRLRLRIDHLSITSDGSINFHTSDNCTAAYLLGFRHGFTSQPPSHVPPRNG